MRLRAELDLEEAKEAHTKIEQRRPVQEPEAWDHENANELAEDRRRVDAARALVEAAKAEEDQATGQAAAAARELAEAEPDLKAAEQSLARLMAQPGWEAWGHLVGLHAVATMVHPYGAVSGDLFLPEDVARVRRALHAAMQAQPLERRWLDAAAFLEEDCGDPETAAELTIRAWALVDEDAGRDVSRFASPQDNRKWAAPAAVRASTYRRAFELTSQAGNWMDAGTFAQLYMLRVCRQPIQETKIRATFADVVRCIREVVAGKLRDREFGLWSAEVFLADCREISDDCDAWQALGIDLAVELSAIEWELIEPELAARDPDAAAVGAGMTDRGFQQLGKKLGITIENGHIKVDGQGACRLDAARASVTPPVRRPQLTGRGSPRITITAKGFDAEVDANPHDADAGRAQRWADEFNRRAAAGPDESQAPRGVQEGPQPD